MSSTTTKKVDKIYSQIDKIAKKGKDYVLEYYQLIDEIVDRGDYSYLELCLYYYYLIDITNYPSIDDVKKKTWDDVRFQTLSSIMTKLYKLYKSKKVYQISYDFYCDDSSNTILFNTILGQIMEIEDFTQDQKYLVENMEFARLMGQKRTYLDVVKDGVTTRIDVTDDTISEDQNLINRYTIAIDILNS